MAGGQARADKPAVSAPSRPGAAAICHPRRAAGLHGRHPLAAPRRQLAAHPDRPDSCGLFRGNGGDCHGAQPHPARHARPADRALPASAAPCLPAAHGDLVWHRRNLQGAAHLSGHLRAGRHGHPGGGAGRQAGAAAGRRALGANRWQVLWYVIVPGALPDILTGLRIGLGVGWSTLVAAELIAATRGVGFMVQAAGEFLATDVVLAGILVIALIAFTLELGLRALQRRLTPWHGEGL
ncbi:ABC transporter permease subunit [Aeromonas hydrophila]